MAKYKEYKTALKPIRRVKTKAGTAFIFQALTQAGLFQRRLNLSGFVNSSSKVFVSIAEVALIGGTLKPFSGAATMTVHNVIPQDDGIVLVRGNTGFNAPLNVRLSVVVF